MLIRLIKLVETYVRFKVGAEVVGKLANMSAGVDVSKYHKVVACMLEKLHDIRNIQSFCDLVFLKEKISQTLIKIAYLCWTGP